METLLDQAVRTSAPKKAARKASAKKSSYDKLISNGWGGLLKTMKPETIKKLKTM